MNILIRDENNENEFERKKFLDENNEKKYLWLFGFVLKSITIQDK